jgi:hypothetical protein
MVTTNVNLVNALIFLNTFFLIVMFLECDSGFYGRNCIQQCGHCFLETCNHVDGTCNLCSDDYFGPKCDKGAFQKFHIKSFFSFSFFSSCQKVLRLLSPVLLLLLFVLLLLLMLLVILLVLHLLLILERLVNPQNLTFPQNLQNDLEHTRQYHTEAEETIEFLNTSLITLKENDSIYNHTSDPIINDKNTKGQNSTKSQPSQSFQEM